MNETYKTLLCNIKTYICTLLKISLRNIQSNIFPGKTKKIEHVI